MCGVDGTWNPQFGADPVMPGSVQRAVCSVDGTGVNPKSTPALLLPSWP